MIYILFIISLCITGTLVYIYYCTYYSKKNKKSNIYAKEQINTCKKTWSLEELEPYKEPIRRKKKYTKKIEIDEDFYANRVSYIDIYKNHEKTFIKAKIGGFYKEPVEISQEDYNNYLLDNGYQKTLIFKYYKEAIDYCMQGNGWQILPIPDEKCLFVRLKLEYINNDKHLWNFINYLLRTDTAQRWTNEDTDTCNILFFNKPDKVFLLGNLESRIKKRNITYYSFLKYVNNDIRNLRMGVTEINNEDREGICIPDSNDRKRIFLRYICETKNKSDGWIPLCYVEHSDGNNRCYHIHEILIKEDIYNKI